MPWEGVGTRGPGRLGVATQMEMAGSGSDVGVQFAELIPECLCLCRRGRVLYVNAGGLRMLGLTRRDELVGRPLADVVQPDYRPIIEGGLSVLTEDESVPLMFLRADGSEVEAEVRARRLPPDAVGGFGLDLSIGAMGVGGHGPREGNDDGFVVLHARDVTDRLRAVKDALDSEKRYRALVDQALDFMCLVRVDGTVDLLNRSGLLMLGRAGEEDGLAGRSVREFVHPDYHGVLDLGLDALADEPGLVPIKFIDRDGEAIDVEIRVAALRHGAGAFMIEARDIGARLRSAEAIREREARLQGILDTVAEGIVTSDTRGVIQSFNKAAERIFGLSAKDAVGQNLAILIPGPDAALHDSYIEEYLEPGRRRRGVIDVGRELEGRRADGTTFPLELMVSELRQGKTLLFTGVIRDITDRKRAEAVERRYKADLEQRVEERTRELRRLSHQTRGILESAGDGIVGLDLDGVITFANPAAAETLGWGDATLIGLKAEEVFRYGDGRRRGRGVPVRAALRRGVFHDRTELILMRRDGSPFATEYASSPIEDEGERTGAVVVLRDVSERKAAEERLTVAAAVFETTAEGIVVCSPDGRISMVNPSWAEITGHAPRASMGASVETLLFSHDVAEWRSMREELASQGHAEREVWCQRGDGARYAARLVGSVVPDKSGGLRALVLIVSDITQRKEDEDRIRFQANYDQLTRLPNRMLFHDRLEQGVAAARRGGTMLGLMFIDLDGFKAINDTLGHEAGDLLLKGAASRLKECVRETDTVARLGGDEFTVIMTNLDGAEGAARVARRIIESLTVPFDLSGDGGAPRQGRVSASIGIALLPRDGDTAEDILRNADAAMYHAKDQGKANFQFYQPALSPLV